MFLSLFFLVGSFQFSLFGKDNYPKIPISRLVNYSWKSRLPLLIVQSEYGLIIIKANQKLIDNILSNGIQHGTNLQLRNNSRSTCKL